MIKRQFWLEKIYGAWQKRSIVWLSGLRRVGKTSLAQQIPNALYLNCDLPSVQEQLEQIEFFLSSQQASVIIFDEIHRLPNPSQILKIAADEFSHIKILATGSSTLSATKKFSDTLTGRKVNVHLLPVISTELAEFAVNNIKERLFFGGLPEILLKKENDPSYYNEWLDSFYARDIQELFKVQRRDSFILLLKLLMNQSGELLDISRLASNVEISRPTVYNYLDALQISHALYLVRPYVSGQIKELLRHPKAYTFDCGFIRFFKGWDVLRHDDYGLLFEHVVLDKLRAEQPDRAIHFWRDRNGNEIDFVIPYGRKKCMAIECKWNHERFNPKAMRLLRRKQKDGENIVVSPTVRHMFKKKYGDLVVTFTNHCAEHITSAMINQ